MLTIPYSGVVHCLATKWDCEIEKKEKEVSYGLVGGCCTNPLAQNEAIMWRPAGKADTAQWSEATEQ